MGKSITIHLKVFNITFLLKNNTDYIDKYQKIYMSSRYCLPNIKGEDNEDNKGLQERKKSCMQMQLRLLNNHLFFLIINKTFFFTNKSHKTSKIIHDARKIFGP